MKYVAFLLTIFYAVASNAQDISAFGTGARLQTATDNSYVSAHFKCGRVGRWADLDALTVTSVDLSRHVLPNGRRKITFYKVNVQTSCIDEYKKTPTESATANPQ